MTNGPEQTPVRGPITDHFRGDSRLDRDDRLGYRALTGLDGNGPYLTVEVLPSTVPDHWHLAFVDVRSAAYTARPVWHGNIPTWFRQNANIEIETLDWFAEPAAPVEKNPYDCERVSKKRTSYEATIRDDVAAYLRGCGMQARTEKPMTYGTCDIAAGTKEELLIVAEVKVSDPIRGLGQLFGYRKGCSPPPTLVLATPNLYADALTIAACEESGVELWYVEADGEPKRVVGSPNPRYPKHMIRSFF